MGLPEGAPQLRLADEAGTTTADIVLNDEGTVWLKIGPSILRARLSEAAAAQLKALRGGW